MQLTQNYSVSQSELERLQAMKAAALKKHIKSLNLFGGYPSEFAKSKEKEVYEKINARRVVKKAQQIESTSAPEGNEGDNPEGSEDSQ